MMKVIFCAILLISSVYCALPEAQDNCVEYTDLGITINTLPTALLNITEENKETFFDTTREYTYTLSSSITVTEVLEEFDSKDDVTAGFTDGVSIIRVAFPSALDVDIKFEFTGTLTGVCVNFDQCPIAECDEDADSKIKSLCRRYLPTAEKCRFGGYNFGEDDDDEPLSITIRSTSLTALATSFIDGEPVIDIPIYYFVVRGSEGTDFTMAITKYA
eukprot:TRINITY_DN1913_c0_g1_i1.p1 TRINITY_DN1913_c0_g1~~TRINITY_DN1913_c0_g1_i1.p1  ORF type:complete len:217 (+),score=57.84 TRINITY_DN1913_c0_g1_i1:35-685(+)